MKHYKIVYMNDPTNKQKYTFVYMYMNLYVYEYSYLKTRKI